jgi:putative DNA primase/helicase
MDARAITKALGGKWQGPYGLCRCPVHADKTPSLKVRDDPRKSDGVDVHCFAGCGWQDVKAILTRQGLLPEFEPGSTVAPHAPSPVIEVEDTDAKNKREIARQIWIASKPLPGTLGWRYFTERRGLHTGALGELFHALRWHQDIGAVVALMTTPRGNKPSGIHRTFLNPDGTKRERKMLGKMGVIRLSRDEDVTDGLGIVEGVEDGVAVLLSGWGPIWCATSAGAIERFPAISGIESLTIFSDNDAPGMKAARACAARWTDADREARLSPSGALSDAA